MQILNKKESLLRYLNCLYYKFYSVVTWQNGHKSFTPTRNMGLKTRKDERILLAAMFNVMKMTYFILCLRTSKISLKTFETTE